MRQPERFLEIHAVEERLTKGFDFGASMILRKMRKAPLSTNLFKMLLERWDDWREFLSSTERLFTLDHRKLLDVFGNKGGFIPGLCRRASVGQLPLDMAENTGGRCRCATRNLEFSKHQSNFSHLLNEESS